MTAIHVKRALPNRAWGLVPDLASGVGRFFDIAAPFSTSDAASADLYETDEALVLEMTLPGLTGEDLDISVEGRQLTIKANLPEIGGEGRRYWFRGIVRGEISRSITLPSTIDVDAISARVENGVLRMTMPKALEAKARKIAISDD